MLITRVHERLLPTALAYQTAEPTNRLHAAAASYRQALDTLAEQNGLTA